MLFRELIRFDNSNADQYSNAFTTMIDWMKNFPLKTNKWGPFFEDIPGWSDTQINAITFAMFILRNP